MTRFTTAVLRTVAALMLAASASTVLAIELVSVVRDDINMRAGPGTSHEALWSLPRGYPLQVIGRRGNWLQVRDFEQDLGWVYRPLTGKAPHFVVKSTTATIRSGPGTRHRRIGSAERGEVLKTLARRGDWVQVRQQGGLKGWVARRLLWGW